MNDTPKTVEVRNGIDAGDLGKESGHTHKLLCRLRHAGLTRRDLVRMKDVDITILGEFIAKVRGVQQPQDCNLDSWIVNLDYEPGYPVPLSTFSGGRFDKDVSVLLDIRLGIWPYIENGGTYIFGDMKFAVKRTTGTCVEGKTYCSGNLGFPRGYKGLNLAMAVWFWQNSWIDVPFDNRLVGTQRGSKRIFFLGTVWWAEIAQKYLAPTLVSNEKGDEIRLEIEAIPNGEWPKNCFVALLVPR